MIPVCRWPLLMLLCFAVCPISAALAADPRTIACDLQACLDLAFANHPRLKMGEARQAAARSQFDVRLAERQPSLTLEGETGYLTGNAITPFSAIARITEEGIDQRRVSGGYYQAMLGLDVPLIKEGTLYGRPSAAVRQAQLKISEEEWHLHGLRLQVAMQVAEAYVQLLKHRKAVQLQMMIVTTLEEGYKLEQSRFQQQLISRNELLRAEVRVATAKRDLALARLNLQKSQHVLATAMGLDQASIIDVQEVQAPPQPLPPLDSLLTQARRTHPELKAGQFEVQGHLEETGRILAERYPTLTLTTRYGIVDDFDGRLNDQWIAALKVKVPVFDFGLTDRKAEVARARVIEAEHQLQDLQLGLEQQVRTLYLLLHTLDDQVALLHTQIAQATEQMQLNRAMAQQQLLPPSDVLDAEAASLRLQLALAETEYDRHLARLQLNLISGTWALQGVLP
ncbi:MAG TPA: TolC family protein [Alphaproteobacteria bacterium]|nr:TolC family protein [Alphaproteobacteria bacterium]